MHVIKIQDTAKYYQVGIADYYPVAGAVLIAAVCYYLMKKENQIEEEEKEPFGKVMRDTPGILRQIFIQDFSEKKENTGERKRIEKKAEKVQIREDASLNQWQSFILQLGTSSVFLLFCLLYTGDLVYKLFSELSFIKWVMELLPILLCVALWKIYFGSKNGKPDESGFSIARGVMTAEYVIQILVSVPVCMVGTVFGGPVGLILALAVSLVDICYIGSLRKTTLCTEKIIKGDGESVTVSFYPVLVLGFNVMIKTVGFLWAAFWQSAANAVTNSMYGYGDEASSLMAGFFSSLGIDYGYSYGQSSSFIQSLLSPVEAWIQSKFGFNENPLVMLLAIAIPVCEIILLRRVRSFKGVITGVDERQDLKG
ncbi:MAG: hypothetical protein Q4C61_17470 [Lachnospiraceae bacterium]|nr:hypothetical protein [Lachnospiraceae bacterium]